MQRKIKKSRNFSVPVMRQKSGAGVHNKKTNRRREKNNILDDFYNELETEIEENKYLEE